MNPLTISELNAQIKALIESHFLQIVVQGEISALTKASSGHIYFTLKDENSQIKATLWKGNAQKLKFALENGLSIIVQGSVKVYAPRGDYQLDCFLIEPLGAGALALAYEQLKKKLLEKGYFDEVHKKPLPKFLKSVALITSKSGAVLHDMMRVAEKRWPLVKFTLFDTLVQGEQAAKMIADKIILADTLGFDAIVVARGGGSAEDLWCFNEEVVAETIFNAKTPIVSAIGHETDNPLSDFVADLRAPTPSAAMQMILPDINEMRQLLDDYALRLDMTFRQGYVKKQKELSDLRAIMPKFSPLQKIESFKEQAVFFKTILSSALNEKISSREYLVKNAKNGIIASFEASLSRKQNALFDLAAKFTAQNPNVKLSDGYAMIVKNGAKTPLEALKVGDEFELQSVKTSIGAKISYIK